MRARHFRRDTPPANQGIVAIAALALVLLVCSCDGSPLTGRELDEHGRLKSLRFMHIPKTGTSFIIMLRNYLTSCTAKDMTCPGLMGGFDTKFQFQGSQNEMSCDGNLVSDVLCLVASSASTLQLCGARK